MNSIIKVFLSFVILISMTTSSQADVFLKDLEGRTIPFSSLKGKWILINYWASWCRTCIAEIPAFNRFYRKHQHDSLALFAVNYDSLSSEEQSRLIHDLNIQYPSLVSDPAFALGLGTIMGVPATFIFNPEGELVNTLYGRQNVRSLERAIAHKA
jgi:thiol-disulfide isomerase/thioredoxin